MVEISQGELREALAKEVAGIPRHFRHEPTIRQTIKCTLYNMLKKKALCPVPDFRPPRLSGGFLDLIGVDSSGSVVCAFAINPLVDLKAIKSLEAVPAENKWMITFSKIEKKVKESKFFLKPGIDHLHLEQK
ncbi:MAG: hypothetical protein JRJ12_10800 [Deltaproteobacteria bacterium]|nr:hypothetical protein [Deltaproteobacteria bacterium]MBW2071960.1 hypothetical protein [Deltaproteobacteria bacterium]